MKFRAFVCAALLFCGACGATEPSPVPSTSTSSPSPSPTVATTATPLPTPTPWPTPWPEQERAKVYVLIHLWYLAAPESCSVAGSPTSLWGPWVWYPKKDNPCRTLAGASWLREISAASYPLIGPYDSSNEDVIRWQIRQAKAAGIDGFFAGVYSWAVNLPMVFDRFFGNSAKGIKGLLQIAHEENFKVAIEGWGVPKLEDRAAQTGPWKAEVGRHIAAIAASPYKDAYLTINGKPAYWLIYPDWMPQAEILPFFDGTTSSPRAVSWILRDEKIDHAIELNRKLVNAKVQFPSWSASPTQQGWSPDGDFEYNLDTEIARADIGMIPIAHAYAGFEERVGVPGGPFNPRYGPRDGTTVISGILERAVARGAKMIFIESWNEWGEGSQVEAGINITKWRNESQERTLYQDAAGNDAPFLYLDALRKFNGMQSWVAPQPLPCKAVDPLIRQRTQSVGLCLP